MYYLCVLYHFVLLLLYCGKKVQGLGSIFAWTLRKRKEMVKIKMAWDLRLSVWAMSAERKVFVLIWETGRESVTWSRMARESCA